MTIREEQEQTDHIRDDDHSEECVGQAVQNAEVDAHTTDDARRDVDPYPDPRELDAEEELSLLHAVERAS